MNTPGRPPRAVPERDADPTRGLVPPSHRTPETDEGNRQENGLAADAAVPVDAVTASASGLDPDISPANALLQMGRVARARGSSDDQVRALVNRYTTGRTLGLLGAPRVNVLQLNLALDGRGTEGT